MNMKYLLLLPELLLCSQVILVLGGNPSRPYRGYSTYFLRTCSGCPKWSQLFSAINFYKKRWMGYLRMTYNLFDSIAGYRLAPELKTIFRQLLLRIEKVSSLYLHTGALELQQAQLSYIKMDEPRRTGLFVFTNF